MRKNVNNQVMGMVKWGLPFCLFTFLPLSMMAQDDLYFVPTKKAKVEVVTDNYGLPKDTYYEGSDRSVDEYNRRMKSTYTEIEGDSTKVDIIDFNGQKGVYPDSVKNGDFELTEKLRRFDGYDLTDKAAFWAGYQKGRYDWGWHSPWYYSTFGWYSGWYDPWYDYVWYGGWYGPWYRHWYGWYDPWYYYGWGDPFYYGYYSGRYPVYYGGGYVSRPNSYYRSPRQSFGTGRNRFGNGDRQTAGRGSFGASYGRRPSGTASSRMPSSSHNGSFGASRPSSSSSGSFGGSSRSGGGGGSFGGGGGGGRSGGGGGGFGRHR
jgi:hypothetical protein